MRGIMLKDSSRYFFMRNETLKNLSFSIYEELKNKKEALI